MNKHGMLQLLTGITISGLSWGRGISDYVFADLVLGQKDFSQSSVSQVSAENMNSPWALAIDPVTRKVFVVDHDHGRVLRFSSADSLKSGVAAEAVFGQSSFTTQYPLNSDLGMDSPEGIFFDVKGRLWVADTGNGRVLVYHSASSLPSNPRPDHVYGKPSLSIFYSLNRDATSMGSPAAICVDNEDRLWVADKTDERVLRFDAISGKPDGAAADGVLGPSDFGTYVGIEQDRVLNGPLALAISIQGTLFVGDSRNRIVRFDHAASLPNGAFPDGVLGQPNLWSSVYGTSRNRMSIPIGVTITADDTLWVTDTGNNRLLRFDHVSKKADGAAADGLLGQKDFFAGPAHTDRRGLAWPCGSPSVDTDGKIWICDAANNRVLRFSKDVTRPTLTLVSKVPKTPVEIFYYLDGTVSDDNTISGVFYKLDGKSTKTATLTNKRWRVEMNTLRKGGHTVEIHAVDGAGNPSKTLRVKFQSTGKF